MYVIDICTVCMYGIVYMDLNVLYVIDVYINVCMCMYVYVCTAV